MRESQHKRASSGLINRAFKRKSGANEIIWLCIVLSVPFCANHTSALEAASGFQVSGPSSQQHFDEGKDYVREYNAGLFYLGRGNTAAATAAFEAATKLKPDFKEAHYALGSLYLRLGKTSLAKDEFRRVETIDPDFGDAYNSLGALSALEHQYLAATDQLLRALELDPGNVEALGNMSSVLNDLGGKKAALELLERAVRIAPQYATLYLSKGRELDEMARYSEAMKSYNEALRLDPHLSGLHSSMGLTLLALGQADEATREFHTALELNSNDSIALRGLAQIAGTEGNLTAAAGYLERAVKAGSDDYYCHIRLGKLHQQQGRLKEADAEFRAALRSNTNSNSTEALFGLAKLLHAEGKIQEAQIYFERVQILHQKELAVADATVLNARGVNLWSQGEIEGAVAVFRKVLTIDPGFAIAYHNLGVALAGGRMALDAMDAFRTAIGLRPDLAASHYGLAMLLKDENNPLAEEEFHKAKLLERFVPQLDPNIIPFHNKD